MFSVRTLYANAVNDGVVPLRTSCLLFLDGQGLEDVQSARRGGLVGTAAKWAWKELVANNQHAIHCKAEGQSGANGKNGSNIDAFPSSGSDTPKNRVSMAARSTPNAPAAVAECRPCNETDEQTRAENDPTGGFLEYCHSNPFSPRTTSACAAQTPQSHNEARETLASTPTFYPNEGSRRNNTNTVELIVTECSPWPSDRGTSCSRRNICIGGNMAAAREVSDGLPQTSIFESAVDILNPHLPTIQWLNNPESRARTIVHDQTYCQDDLSVLLSEATNHQKQDSTGMHYLHGAKENLNNTDHSLGGNGKNGIEAENKIACAYQRELSWRKVLVHLEPEAHNNMIVRRKFANAYGWPVVKHLCDNHFTGGPIL